VLFVGLFFTQCNYKIEEEILYIHKLSSPDQRIEIYECFIESPMAFGSGHKETTVLTKGEKYNPRVPGNISEYTILGWVGNDTLKVIKFHKKQDKEIKIPQENLHEIKKFGDFYLDIAHRTSFGGEKDWFSFDSLYLTCDSVVFLQLDSLGLVKDKLGLLKGQIKLSLDNDTVTKISGEYYERIEKHFAKIKECNEFGYPYIIGVNCEITPNYRLKTSIFRKLPITYVVNIEDYK
jgi:hypothetical protein